MKTLIVERDGSLAVRETSMPAINDCQALVKVLACGICNGTDGKLIHREFKNVGIEEYPLMLGHEAVGRVVRTGSKATSFREGDLVVLPFNYAQDGLGAGWGGFSEYGIVDDPVSWDVGAYGPTPECAFAQKVLPKGIDPVDAVMVITLREVLSSIERFGMGRNSSVVVFGCGPVGLSFIRCLSMLGAHPIIALDIKAEKLEDARRMGAEHVFDARDPNHRAAIREICPDGADFVLDAVGVSDIINQAMGLVRDAGKICCYGISSNLSATIDWTDAPYNWQLLFQQMPSKLEEGAMHAQVINWIEAGVVTLRDWITDVCDFDDVLEAFAKLERGEIAGKCVVRFPD